MFCSLVCVAEAVSSLRHVIPGSGRVVGVASLGNMLFVVRCAAGQQIEVYDTETLLFQGKISVPGLNSPHGLASCATNKCLYACDCNNNNVYRVGLADITKITNWSVSRYPTGLSVNSATGNVFVTCNADNKIQDYTTQGRIDNTGLSYTDLQYTGITSPWHAIQLSSGHFAVSHDHRVCVIDKSAHIIFSYGFPKTAGSKVGQFSYPRGLVELNNGCILVADCNNDRVVALNSSLSFGKEITLPVEGGLHRPWALHYDKSRGRLYIGEFEGGSVLVFDNVSDMQMLDSSVV